MANSIEVVTYALGKRRGHAELEHPGRPADDDTDLPGAVAERDCGQPRQPRDGLRGPRCRARHGRPHRVVHELRDGQHDRHPVDLAARHDPADRGDAHRSAGGAARNGHPDRLGDRERLLARPRLPALARGSKRAGRRSGRRRPAPTRRASTPPPCPTASTTSGSSRGTAPGLRQPTTLPRRSRRVRVDNSSPDQDVLSVAELTGGQFQYFDAAANTQYYNPVGGSGTFRLTAAPRDVQDSIQFRASSAGGNGTGGPLTLDKPAGTTTGRRDDPARRLRDRHERHADPACGLDTADSHRTSEASGARPCTTRSRPRASRRRTPSR